MVLFREMWHVRALHLCCSGSSAVSVYAAAAWQHHIVLWPAKAQVLVKGVVQLLLSSGCTVQVAQGKEATHAHAQVCHPTITNGTPSRCLKRRIPYHVLHD